MLDWRLLAHAQAALDRQEVVTGDLRGAQSPTARIGTLLSNEVAKRYHAAGLPADTIQLSTSPARPGRASARSRSAA
ncbi:MAG: hypothetical protein WKG07_32870 [Hymenobacter sp.]